MDAGDVTAIYAAIVATSALGWQIYVWRHARAQRVHVDVSYGFLAFGHGPVEAVMIKVINRSDRAVIVEDAGVDAQDGSGRTLIIPRPPPGATLPGKLDPDSNGTTWLLREEVDEAGVDVHEPLTGYARLATGETIKSKPARLLSRS